jgi:hypothetical protein
LDISHDGTLREMHLVVDIRFTEGKDGNEGCPTSNRNEEEHIQLLFKSNAFPLNSPLIPWTGKYWEGTTSFKIERIRIRLSPLLQFFHTKYVIAILSYYKEGMNRKDRKFSS